MQHPDRWEIVEIVEVENLLETLYMPAVARIVNDRHLIVEVDASLRGRERAEAIRTVRKSAKRHRHRRGTLLPVPILVGAWEAVRASQRGAVASAAVAATVAAGALSLAVIERGPPPLAQPRATAVSTATTSLATPPAATPTTTRPTTQPTRTRAKPTTRQARTEEPPPARTTPTRQPPKTTQPEPELTRQPDHPDKPTPTRSRASTPPRTRAASLTRQPTAAEAAEEEDSGPLPTVVVRPTVDVPATIPAPVPQLEPTAGLELSTGGRNCRLVEVEVGKLVRVCL